MFSVEVGLAQLTQSQAGLSRMPETGSGETYRKKCQAMMQCSRMGESFHKNLLPAEIPSCRGTD